MRGFYVAVALIHRLGVVICGLVCAVFTSTAAQQARRETAALSVSERADLLLDKNVLRHPSFGFVVPLPGPRFAPDRETQDAVRETLGRHDLFAWAFRVPDDSFFSVTVLVYKGFDGTQEGFRRFFTEILPSGRAGDESIYRDSIYWEGQRREYRLFSQDSRGVTTDERCIPSPQSRKPGVIACVLLVGGDPNQIKIVRDGLRFTAGGP